MIADPLPRRLLILACSATKRHDSDPIPARDRYDGPLWRTLRATDPCGRLARVGFLSARYGFRRAETQIEDYDAKLTRDLAANDRRRHDDQMAAAARQARRGQLWRNAPS